MESIAASSPPQPSRSSPDSAAGCSPPRRAESVRVYSVQSSRLEFIAELGRTDGAHHAPEASNTDLGEPPAQPQGPGELVLAFCSNGTLLGVAYLFADAPHPDQSGDGDGDGDDDEEEGKEQEVYEDSNKDNDTEKKDHCHDEDKDEDEDEDEYEDEDEDEDEDEEEDSDSTRTATATDESSSSGSSIDKDSEDEDKEEGDYDWGDWKGSDADKTKYEEPAHSLKIRVWPSRGYANIVLFDGIRWISTQNYTLRMLSTKAEIMVKELADLSQIHMEVDNALLASNGLLRRSEYEGMLINSATVGIFVRNLSPSIYHFDVKKILGQGSFCNVRLCTGGDQTDYAIKIIKTEDEELNEPREVAILSSLRHSHVVKLIQAWTESQISVSYEECSSSEMSSEGDDASDDSRESWKGRKYMQRSRYILILMELCQGTLGDYLSTESRELDAEKSMQIFNEIVKGLHYVHGQNIIHRDMKPSNVFLGKDEKFKIGDFGQSRWQPRYNVSFKATPNLGTRFYAAPELKDGERISDKVDIYPLGVIYFELFNIFKTMLAKDKMFRKLRDGDSSKIIWEGDSCLFRLMTASDPVKRPSVNDVLEYISQVRLSLEKTEVNSLCQPGQSEEVNSTPTEEADTPRGET